MKFLHKILSFSSRSVNVFFFTLLLFAGLAAYISPSRFWPLGLMGLAYPYLALANIFFVLSWMLRKRAFALLSLSALILTFPQLKAQLAFSFSRHVQTTAGSPIKVMSYNVRNFDLYNWSHNKASRKSMMDSIATHNPDVLLLQEYYTDNGKFNNDEYLKRLGYTYHQTAVELIKKRTNVWGVSIFSKYPIQNGGNAIQQQVPTPYRKFPKRCAYADIKIHGQTIRFISIHMQSVHLSFNDYETIDNLKASNKLNPRRVLIIIKKLKRAFIERGRQTETLRQFLQQSPYPVILGGDFNDTPASFTYQQIANLLDDTFIQKGRGIGTTYNGNIPFLRIDYILKDHSFQTQDFKIINNLNSDHFAVVSDILIPTHPVKDI